MTTQESEAGGLADLANAVSVAIKVLNRRVLTLLALVMTFGLFCAAMNMGTWTHFVIAGAFGVTIFLPIMWKEVPRG